MIKINDNETLYYCNARKNKGCPKTSCYLNNGPCHMTTNKKYIARGILKFIMWLRFHKEDMQFNERG